MLRADRLCQKLKFSVITLMLSFVACLNAAEPAAATTASSPTPVDQYGMQLAMEPTPERALPADITGSVGTGQEFSSIPKKFQYAFRLNVRGVYDDNIFLSQTGQPIGDFYLAIEPGITLGYGDVVGENRNFIQFDYAPSFFLYAEHSNANATQHLMRLTGAYRLGHLSMTLDQDVELRNGTNPVSASNIGSANPGPGINLDTGGGGDQDIFTTNANFSYDLTGKTFLSGGLHYILYEYPSLIGSQTFQGNLFINFTYSPKLTIGLGGTLGYNRVEDNSPDQTFEQINCNLTYQLTGKVSLNGTFGMEIRQFENNSRGSYTSPVYQINASYQPFDGTTVTLGGSRRTQNSAVLTAQDYSLTDITLSVRQRFLQRLYLGVTTGYENSSYFSTVAGVNASRDDNYYFVQPSVDVTITRYWTAGFYYLHRQSDSSFQSFSFYDNQYGFRTSLTF